MNKQVFLEELKDELINRSVEEKSILDILEDYQMMIDEALDNGLDEEEYIQRLGSPSRIAGSLRYEKRKERVKDSKIIALSPFLAVAAYFVLGFYYQLWHPGWLVFLIIPIAGVLFGTDQIKERVVGLTPFVSVILYMLLGTYASLWHPAWLIFFIIPLAGTLFLKDGNKKILGLIAYGVIPLIYLYLNSLGVNSWYGLIFLITLGLGIYTGEIQLHVGIAGDSELSKQYKYRFIVIVISLLVIYFLFNLIFALWHPTWVIFLLFPMYVMYTVAHEIDPEEDIPFVAYTPFIATILFVLVGHFFDFYHLSWMFFLLIPVVAILSDRD